jgi:glycine/D-amino acid oxidase-like deaminating enzyme
MNQVLNSDIVIVGGGVAGLWTLNRLRSQGYQAILLEKNALGFGQTIASQGIIHGGIKYALTGALSDSSLQISDMPARWQACLQGQGDIDLSATQILSNHYYLCSQQKITQRITQFFAQKALQSDSDALAKTHYPAFFQHKDFQGLLTLVHECVVDVPSLIQALAKNMMPYIFKINTCQLEKMDTRYSIKLDNALLHANRIILTAGEGNADLFPFAAMQKRPLQMVVLKADNLPRIFVHCVGLSTNPILTITSHLCHNGQTLWYLGGQIAEEGVHRDTQTQIEMAQTLIQHQFPWFTPINPRWQTLNINRAEGFNHGKRPESIRVNTLENVITAWPTKLTFAPLLAEKIITMLPPPGFEKMPELNLGPKPDIAQPIWESLC